MISSGNLRRKTIPVNVRQMSTLIDIGKSDNRCRWYSVWAFLEAYPKDRNPYYRLIRFLQEIPGMAYIRYPIQTKFRYDDEIHKICDSHTGSSFLTWILCTPFLWARKRDSIDLCQWKPEVNFFSLKNIAYRQQPKISSYRRCGKKGGKRLIFLLFFNGCKWHKLFFFIANCQHADINQLVRRLTLDLDMYSAHGQPAWCRARPASIDAGLEDIRWIHGLGRESLMAVSYVILPNPRKKLFFENLRHLSCEHERLKNCFFRHFSKVWTFPFC